MIQYYVLNDDPWAGKRIGYLMPPWANSCQPYDWVGRDGVIFRHDDTLKKWVFAINPDTLSPENRTILNNLLAKKICAPYVPEPRELQGTHEPHHSI